MNGSDLLAEYRSTGSEEAFTGLVRRYANLVYSVALRRFSNATLAEEATQLVFTRLASKRPAINTDPQLVAWLHRTTVHISIDLWRAETRRRNRELAAAMDAQATETTQSSWEEIAPHLDECLNELDDADRQVLLLRFFERKSMAEVGRAFAVSEDAAKMRVSRALERLRAQLLPRAVALSVAMLATMVTARSIEAAPAALVTRLSTLHRLGSTPSAVEPLLQTTRAKIIAAGGLVVIVALLMVSRVLQSPVDRHPLPNASGQISAVVARPPLNGKRPTLINAAKPPPSPNVRMVFRVVDAQTAQPIPNAQIRAAYFYAGGRGEGHQLVTDQNGIAGVPEPNEGGHPGMNLFVSTAGYVPKSIGFGPNPPAEYLFKAEPAALVAGTVVDETGAPVPDVAIEASRSDDYKNDSPNTDFQTTHVKTDPSGRFLYHYIPTSYQDVTFTLAADGYAVTRASVSMRPAEAANARLIIKRGFAVAGRVTDSAGSPVFNATVREFHNYGHRKLSTETDFNGEYQLLGLSAPLEPKAEIVVQAEGMAPQLKPVELREPTNVLNFVLAAGVWFHGRVIDEAGQPIANAAVRTDSDNQGRRPFQWFTRTDDDGRFEWNSAPTQETLFWFEADGYEVIRDIPMVPDGKDLEIKLKWKRASK